MKRILLCLLLLLSFGGTALAAQAEDFSYQGLRLGDSHAQMLEKLREPRTDIDKVVGGKNITYYFYKDTRIGIDGKKDAIVDMRIGDKAYVAKNGVKLGATPHKILKEYGKCSREHVEGHIYYIYHNEEDPAQKLMFDISEGHLGEIRITDLDA